MIDKRLVRRVALTLGILAAHSPNADEAVPNPPVSNLILEKQVDLPSPRLNTKVVRTLFPPAYKTPLHTHEGPGPRYVMRGKLRVEEAGQVNTFGPGEVFWETGQWITVENVGPDEAEVISVELATRK